jgi:hypothetical protein
MANITIINETDVISDSRSTINNNFSNLNTDESRARVYRNSSAQTISTSSETKVQFNAESYDKSNEFDSTSDYDFTVTTAGRYLITAQVVWASAVDQKNLQIRLFKNTGRILNNHIQSSGTGIHTSVLFDIVTLAASDTLEIRVFQDTGGDVDLTNGEDKTFFAIHRIS